MWNILIVLIIATIIFMLNPFKTSQLSSPAKIDSQTKNEVNQVLNQTTKQINQAKTLQKQENSELESNQ